MGWANKMNLPVETPARKRAKESRGGLFASNGEEGQIVVICLSGEENDLRQFLQKFLDEKYNFPIHSKKEEGNPGMLGL